MTAAKLGPAGSPGTNEVDLRRTEENGNQADQISSHSDRAKTEPEVKAHRKGEAGGPLKELPAR